MSPAKNMSLSERLADNTLDQLSERSIYNTLTSQINTPAQANQ